MLVANITSSTHSWVVQFDRSNKLRMDFFIAAQIAQVARSISFALAGQFGQSGPQ